MKKNLKIIKIILKYFKLKYYEVYFLYSNYKCQDFQKYKFIKNIIFYRILIQSNI